MLRFESVPPSVRVHMRRHWAGFGVGESSLFDLLGLWVEEPGTPSACAAIVDAAQLHYTNSHHNWNDAAEGAAGGVRYLVTMNVGTPFTLTVTEIASARVTLGPTNLVTTGGPIGPNAGPSRLPVYVSELMPANTTGWKDDAGDYEPWIELFNASSDVVDLSGYFLSNDPAQPRLWAFPAGNFHCS